MIEVFRERRIEALPERVWPFVEDLDRLTEWFDLAERAELLDGKGLGRRQRIHSRWGRKRSEIDQVVVDYRPKRLISWRHEAERLDGRPAPRFAQETVFTIRLVADDGGTIVSLESRQRPAGPLRGLAMDLFARRSLMRHLERSLDRLSEVSTAAS